MLKIMTKTVSIVFIIIMDVLKGEHEKGGNFELQLRKRKHTFEGIIVSRGKTEYMLRPENDQTICTATRRDETIQGTVQFSGLIVP